VATALAGALLCGPLAGLNPPPWPRRLIDWQPGLAASEPWRALSAVAVHYSGLHLAANLAGAALVAALGWAALLPRACTLAWALAWPLTQLGLLLQPALLHYGGLSGVLHAGVAVAGAQLAWHARGGRRTVGVAVLAVLALKLLSEAPWGEALRQPPGWDIQVAPFAHTSGALAGLLCWAIIQGMGARRRQAAR
jgi:rhomboid family GlyGly-CTERM serine protease